MLYIISLGLSDEKDISLKGLEAARGCEKIYAEFYTIKMRTSIEKLEKLFGKKVFELQRQDLEEKSSTLIRQAKEKDIALLVGGDALSATTHASLILECRQKNIPCQIIHGSSIFTAIAECGLSLYKFGETVTLPRWKKDYQPTSFYETIEKNKKAGLHSLILLDVDMQSGQGRDLLEKIEAQKKKNLFSKQKIIVASKLGSSNQLLWYGFFEKIPQAEPPAVFVLPGRLNEFEKEFLETI